MKLEQFRLEDFTHSQTATRFGLDNQPGPAQAANLVALHSAVLVPLAKGLSTQVGGRSIQISSGFRSRRVNSRVGGSPSSQHCSGEAVDFTVTGMTVTQVCDWILSNGASFMKQGFDQLIHEFGDWVHLSFRAEGGNRNQALRAMRVRLPLGITKIVYVGY